MASSTNSNSYHHHHHHYYYYNLLGTSRNKNNHLPIYIYIYCLYTYTQHPLASTIYCLTSLRALYNSPPSSLLPLPPSHPPVSKAHLRTTQQPPLSAMAAFASTSSAVSGMPCRGRSGYNKDGDNEDNKRSFGRSGYNKGGDDDEDSRLVNFGRSGYNKGDDDEDSQSASFGRSGYN
ncbi:hypothetical protein GGS23DRAFT_432990 [Durotheca rogersii]|uniref:uncharacterized protein n=1 Tax=Durotheca rogersii TaxID=419775 RepID=UPI00221F56C5|nr:uncharacterized protein GGS23DRAFT_432990 [Durotheca rogersii]KAI5865561.1 hypothetical protein GGS23DRAFT_432990 [Durotheca rogersii]